MILKIKLYGLRPPSNSNDGQFEMHFTGSNYSIRDEIKNFWSDRAATFDESVGHEIYSEAEYRGWKRLILKHLGEGRGQAALDLACGTGVFSHLMHDAGFKVTGLDWSDAMLEQARSKARHRGAEIRFVAGDAENTMEPPQSYDVITNRFLIWTLVDPIAAFNEWFCLLKPGGKLLILDGDWGKESWIKKLQKAWGRLSGRPCVAGLSSEMAERHRRIREQVYFSSSMSAEAIVALLQASGFCDIVVDRKLMDIHIAQARKMPLLRGLDCMLYDRYAISARKPSLS